MRHFILLILTIGQLSCDNKKLTVDTGDKNERITKTDSLDQQRTTLIIDTLTKAEFINLFKEKQRANYDIHNDKSLETNLNQSSDFWVQQMLLVNDTLKRIAVWGYPLSFKENKNKINWLTTLSEGEAGTKITLFTLDKYYNMVDNAVISSYGGDEGINGWTLGKFKNDSTYATRTFTTGYETDSIESVINSCLIIHADGKIERIKNCR